MKIPRREFVVALPLTLTAAAAAARVRGSSVAEPEAVDPAYPQQDPDLVRQLVGAAHGNEARVRELVGDYPSMVNAAWDWGFGDWETPLGAAAHTGRRGIAEFLLEKGARMDIFALAMLGHQAALAASLAASPGLARTRGPHGITLLAHARAGGAEAAATVEFLQGVPEADIPEPDLPLAESERDALLGVYRFGPGEKDRFDVIFNRTLQIQKPGHAARPLRQCAPGAFAPAGATGVRIEFEADTLLIIDGPRRLAARRG